MSFSRRVAVSATALAALAVAAPVTACSSGSPAPASSSAGPGATAPGSGAPGGGASGAGSSAGSPAIVPGAASTLSWHACSDSLAGMQCASLRVPLNYADPGGRTITLALSMVPATAPESQRQGVLLVNPGGPGAPGLSLAGAVAAGLNPRVAAEYDIVGFDPRGVGSSVPALSCDPRFFSGVRPDYVPANAAAEQVLIGRAKTYAADCQRRFGWLLPYLTTRNVARDLDSIRRAFGVSKISYYAFSYGTYLGQVYATLFPHGIRRMVLDSTVDPKGVWYADNIGQDYAFQGRQQAFFAWIAKNDGTYQLGTTGAAVRNAWYEARSRLKAHPVSGPHGPLIGPDEFDDTFLLGGYQNTLWPALAEALSQYLNRGSANALISAYNENGAQNENEFAIYNAVQCADVNWPRDWSKWQSDTERVYRTAPFQAWDNAWYNAACAFWPVHGPAHPLQIKGSGLPAILMLQGTLDAATPYAGAQDAHKLLPSARMVVVEGGGNHGQSLQSPSDNCVQGYLNSYLADGSLPGHPGLVNATCPAVPDPAPGG
jgi:pimeloyl-ACP methyl ester carboxylesterase